MTILAERTKTETGRVIPISARLAGILELAKTDPTGEDFKPEDFVFGDSVSREVTDVKKAWEACLLKAHRHAPKWTQNNLLTPESREAFRAIDLTFHDLPSSRSPQPSSRGRLAARQRVAHAWPREHRADRHVPQRHSGRIAGRHAST